VIHEPVARVDRRTQRRHARTEQVLDAAMKIVGADGLDGLTLHRLAADLGYVPAALYRYFDSKDALLAALQRRTIEELHERLRREQSTLGDRLPAPGPGPGERALLSLLAAADFYLRLPGRLPEHFRLVSSMLGDPRALIEHGTALVNAQALLGFLGDVRELFEQAATAGALAPGRAFDRTLAYWSALHGVATLDKLVRFDAATFDVQRLGALTARALLAGWGADPGSLDAAGRALSHAAPPAD